MAIKVPDWKGDFAYVGKSKAIVIDNRDPLKKGRIRVQSPAFGITGFIHFLTSDDGKFSPPDIGSIVYVEAAGADKRFPIAISVINDGDDNNPDTPSIFQRDIPTNRGWVSPGILDSTGKSSIPNGGHSLEMDDGIAILSGNIVTQTSENRGIRLITFGGHSFRMIEEGSEGSQENRVETKTSGGQSVELVDDTDPAGQQVTVKDTEGRTIEIIKATDKITIRNASGSIFIDVDLANDTIEIDADNVKLGTNAAQAIVRGDAFRTLFNAHRHVSGAPGVPTGPPITPMDPASANTHLSDKHKVE